MTKDTDDLAELYRRAYAEFGTRALSNMRLVANPTPGDALAITAALRTHGRMDGRRLAERIEALCRADLGSNPPFSVGWPRNAAQKAMSQAGSPLIWDRPRAGKREATITSIKQRLERRGGRCRGFQCG